MASSVEVTYWDENGWHPHIHAIVCSDNEVKHYKIEGFKNLVSNTQLMDEWKTITWDSNMVSIRKIQIDKHHFERQWIAEVFKYAVKFSSLSVEKLVELIELQKKKNYRFYATSWVFRWRKSINMKVGEKITDDEINCATNLLLWYTYDNKSKIYRFKKNLNE